MHSAFFNETFWVAISIIMIVAVIFKYSRAPVKEFLNQKAASISRKIDEATLLQSEAERMLQEQIELYKKATKQAQELLASAKDEATLLQKRAQEDFLEKLNYKKSTMKKNIFDGEVRLLRQLRLKAVERAIAMSITALSSKENDQLKVRLLNEALKAIEAKLAT